VCLGVGGKATMEKRRGGFAREVLAFGGSTLARGGSFLSAGFCCGGGCVFKYS